MTDWKSIVEYAVSTAKELDTRIWEASNLLEGRRRHARYWENETRRLEEQAAKLQTEIEASRERREVKERNVREAERKIEKMTAARDFLLQVPRTAKEEAEDAASGPEAPAPTASVPPGPQDDAASSEGLPAILTGFLQLTPEEEEAEAAAGGGETVFRQSPEYGPRGPAGATRVRVARRLGNEPPLERTRVMEVLLPVMVNTTEDNPISLTMVDQLLRGHGVVSDGDDPRNNLRGFIARYRVPRNGAPGWDTLKTPPEEQVNDRPRIFKGLKSGKDYFLYLTPEGRRCLELGRPDPAATWDNPPPPESWLEDKAARSARLRAEKAALEALPRAPARQEEGAPEEDGGEEPRGAEPERQAA